MMAQMSVAAQKRAGKVGHSGFRRHRAFEGHNQTNKQKKYLHLSWFLLTDDGTNHLEKRAMPIVDHSGTLRGTIGETFVLESVFSFFSVSVRCFFRKHSRRQGPKWQICKEKWYKIEGERSQEEWCPYVINSVDPNTNASPISFFVAENQNQKKKEEEEEERKKRKKPMILTS
jgi:hypothetical protein